MRTSSHAAVFREALRRALAPAREGDISSALNIFGGLGAWGSCQSRTGSLRVKDGRVAMASSGQGTQGTGPWELQVARICRTWAEQYRGSRSRVRAPQDSRGVSDERLPQGSGTARAPSWPVSTSQRHRRGIGGRVGIGGGCYEPRIRELLQACPTMPATVIAERIGWPYSIRTLSTRVAELRPIYLPPDPASRTTYLAGEIAQCDFWFPPIRLPVGFGQTRTATQLPVLTMITGYARWASALLLPTRRAEDLYAGWWRLLQQLGAVPRVLVWDGEGAVGRWRPRQSELTSACQGFRGVLGAKVIICKPADPEAKGIIERLHDYLERSFLPGRSFDSPADFNTQLRPMAAAGQHSPQTVVGLCPGGPDRRGQGGDVGPAAGAAADRMGAHAAAAPGSLCAFGQQRLLGASLGRRPPGPGPRRPGPGSGLV